MSGPRKKNIMSMILHESILLQHFQMQHIFTIKRSFINVNDPSGYYKHIAMVILHRYPPVICYIAIEHGQFLVDFPIKDEDVP